MEKKNAPRVSFTSACGRPVLTNRGSHPLHVPSRYRGAYGKGSSLLPGSLQSLVSVSLRFVLVFRQGFFVGEHPHTQNSQRHCEYWQPYEPDYCSNGNIRRGVSDNLASELATGRLSRMAAFDRYRYVCFCWGVRKASLAAGRFPRHHCRVHPPRNAPVSILATTHSLVPRSWNPLAPRPTLVRLTKATGELN